jgi:hypothetical protein
MRFAGPVALSLLALPLLAQQHTTITTTPATPAWGETFTFTVRGTWPNGCAPKFQSVTAGTTPHTIRINATGTDCASVCPQIVTPYRFETSPGVIQNPGFYTIEYHVICNDNDTLITSTTLAIAFHCQFDRALSSSAPAARVGSSVNLHWCDPSVIQGPDQGVSVTFFRVLMARSANGPFVPLSDVPVTDLGVTFDSTDVGSLFFFVEAHECNETIAGCTGDTIVRSNVIRIDVVPQNGCLPDATTLCLNGSRFQVTAQWHTNDGNSGAGQAVTMTSDSGYFWFFGADNVELVVKALNACTLLSPTFWVFASGLTNVGVDLTITDTKSGQTKTYHNPINQPFVSIQDTAAFATCP